MPDAGAIWDDREQFDRSIGCFDLSHAFCKEYGMANQLKKFMIKLAEDPGALKAFKADPHDAMVNEGLHSEDIAAVLSKRPELIREKLGGGGLRAAGDDVTVVVVVL
jgi:hypothetical protein